MKKPPNTAATGFKDWTQAHFMYSLLLEAYNTKNPDVMVDDMKRVAGAHIRSKPSQFVGCRVAFINKRLDRMACGFRVTPGRLKQSFRLVAVA